MKHEWKEPTGGQNDQAALVQVELVEMFNRARHYGICEGAAPSGATEGASGLLSPRTGRNGRAALSIKEGGVARVESHLAGHRACSPLSINRNISRARAANVVAAGTHLRSRAALNVVMPTSTFDSFWPLTVNVCAPPYAPLGWSAGL